MVDKLKQNIIFYLLLMLGFYLIPWLIRDMGGSAMMTLLVIIPLICLVTSIFYGIKNGFDIWYVLIVAILFAPSIFIFYDLSVWVYIVAYALVALVGNLIALTFQKNNIRFFDFNAKQNSS